MRQGGTRMRLAAHARRQRNRRGADPAGARQRQRARARTSWPEHAVKGTTGWTRYHDHAAVLPKNAERIEVGAMLQGKGTLWLDDVGARVRDDIDDRRTHERLGVGAARAGRADRGRHRFPGRRVRRTRAHVGRGGGGARLRRGPDREVAGLPRRLRRAGAGDRERRAPGRRGEGRGARGRADRPRPMPRSCADVTGYAIGGIPPLAHARPMRTFVDRNLMQYATVYAAGGTPHAMFPITPADLVRVACGAVADTASD